MAYTLLGKNFTPPDVHAKVTGAAKYAEDFRADGMVFLKTYPSPMPHAPGSRRSTSRPSRRCLASWACCCQASSSSPRTRATRS